MKRTQLTGRTFQGKGARGVALWPLPLLPSPGLRVSTYSPWTQGTVLSSAQPCFFHLACTCSLLCESSYSSPRCSGGLLYPHPWREQTSLFLDLTKTLDTQDTCYEPVQCKHLNELLRFEIRSPCIVQANPELAMPLPQPPNYGIIGMCHLACLSSFFF